MFDSKWLTAHAKSSPPRGRFQFRAHVPRKQPEPVMVADKPWESMSLGWHTLLRDGGRYRLWYECWDDTYQRDFDGRLCYAESDDLSTWRKPELGLLEYHGSKQNNILFDATMGHGYGLHGHSVCIDPTAPATHRYRMIYAGYDGRQSGLMTAHSADGLRWQVATKSGFRYRNDTQNVAFWDPGRQKYVGHFRAMEADTRANPGKQVRCIARAETEDFDSWPKPVTVRAPDEADGPDTDLYNNAACRYESAGDVAYLLFPSTFHHDTDTCDVEIATSRDGLNWQRLSRTKVIPNGPAWDAGMAFACPGLVPFRDGYALSYNGCRQKHSETVPRNVRYGGGVGLVEYPTDRFQGLWTEDLEATLCSFPLSQTPPRVRLNAVIEPAGEIRGALMKDGTVLPGCGFDECAPVTGDVFTDELRWKGEGKLHWFAGQTVELRLVMRKACLYAIELAE